MDQQQQHPATTEDIAKAYAGIKVWCFKCDAKVLPNAGFEIRTTKNKRTMLGGTCSVCSCKVSQMVKAIAPEPQGVAS